VDIQPPEVEAATWAEAVLRLGEVAAIREPATQPHAEEAVMESLPIGRMCGQVLSLEVVEWPEERDLPLCTYLRSSDQAAPAEGSDAWMWPS
jgi:hypothetical protein